MFRTLAHYFVALIVLSSCALMYDAFTKKWLQPKIVITVPLGDEGVPQPEDTLSDLFPDDAWQRGLCKRLQTADGELMFQHWEQLSDDKWKLWPITLVVGRGMEEQETPEAEPIILQADEGAEISFSESLDMMSGDAPPIKRGRMIGIVDIRRHTTDPTKHPLMIRTSNVGIDNRKLWTTEAIQLQMGETRMVGRDLTLHLAASAGSNHGGNSAASILDRMELIYLDELTIPLESNALAKSQTKQFDLPVTRRFDPASQPQTTLANIGQPPTSTLTTSTPPPAAAYLKINCDGRVEYDFALDQLSLRDNISFRHHVPNVADDQFICESLELLLRDPENRDMPRISPLDWLSRIEAKGNPAVIDLPSMDCRITADQINLDAMGGLLQVSSGKGIKIHRQGIDAELSQLSYQYNPAEPTAIGNIDILGWGTVRLLDPELPVREFQWSESFKLQPAGVPEPGQPDEEFNVLINGDTKARFSDGGEFRADSIDGFLRAVSVIDQPDNASFVQQPSKSKQTLRPDRFQALGDVRLDNNAASVKTNLLAIYFVDEPNPVPSSTATADGQQKPASPLRQWVEQPNAQSQPTAPVARAKPNITGDKVAATLRMNDDGLSVKDLSVDGGVELIHTVDAGGQLLPAELTGDTLRLANQDGADVLQLSGGVGVPSRFDLGDGFFVGPQINIWPNDNIVRIEGAGEFQMPTAVLPSSLAGNLPGSNQPSRIRWTQAPKCKWNGDMVFDGKMAVLTRGVEISAELINQNEPWSIQMVGDRLEVVLLESVELGQMQSMQGAAVQQVTLLPSETQPVLIQAEQFAADGVREARHVMQAKKLTLLPAGGKLVGAGPGWYRSWMWSNANGPFSPSDESATTTQAGPTSNRNLMGVHLVYHQAMQGDLVNKSLAFIRSVRVGVKQVDDWQATFDAEEMDSVSDGESTIDCDRLQITVAPTNPNQPKLPGLSTPWEMQARDGVFFRTRSERGLVEGTAELAVYSSQKELFSIFGTPTRGAIIKQTRPDGKAGPMLKMRQMSINPKTLELNMDMESVTSGQIPQPQKR